MQTGTGTNYTITLSTSANDGGTLNFNVQSGADDAFVLALAEALKGVTYPSGEAPVTVSVTKVENTATVSEVNWTANPPAFA